MSRFKNFKLQFFPKLLSSLKKNSIPIFGLHKKTIFLLVPFQDLPKNRLTDKDFLIKFLNDVEVGKTNKIKNLKFSSFSNSKCWNCNQYLENKKFSCGLCGCLQFPKNNVNYFELFAMPQTFDMNLEDLSSKFKDLQMIFHPDKFTSKSKTELEISEIYSSLLNKAYATLKEPLKRGLYLLELKKLPKDEYFPLEQEFLISIMEKNEELEGLNSENSLKKFMKTNNEEIHKQIKLISESFSNNNWREAKINLLKLNYYLNLELKIKGKHSNLFLSKLK